MSGEILLPEVATRTTPSSGMVSFFPKEDSNLYRLNAAGIQSVVGLGYDVFVLDETLSGLAAISTDLSQDMPDGAWLLCVQANIETLVVSGGTSVKVGIGPVADPDKYGLTSGFTKNLKIDTIPAHAVLSGAEDVQVNMCATGGGIGDSAASAGAVRVRIVYALPTSLADAA